MPDADCPALPDPGDRPRPRSARWRRILVLGAGLPALCLAFLFAGWVVIPHLRFQYHRRLLASQDREERRQAARSLARLGTEEAVRTLLMEIQKGIQDGPGDHEEVAGHGQSFHLPEEHGLFIEAFRDLDVRALPVVVESLCSDDIRGHGAAFLGLWTFLHARETDENGRTRPSPGRGEEEGDLFHDLETLGVSQALVDRARSCCKKIDEEIRPVFSWEIDSSDE